MEGLVDEECEEEERKKKRIKINKRKEEGGQYL